MRALQNIHAALRPGGLLLDIHPEPKHPWLEAHCEAVTTPIGQLDESYRIKTVLTARTALQHAIDAGLYARERDITFLFTYHFASVEAWQRHMAENWSSAGFSLEMVERARELTLPGAGELRIQREIHATRLRKPE